MNPTTKKALQDERAELKRQIAAIDALLGTTGTEKSEQVNGARKRVKFTVTPYRGKIQGAVAELVRTLPSSYKIDQKEAASQIEKRNNLRFTPHNVEAWLKKEAKDGHLRLLTPGKPKHPAVYYKP